MQAIERFEFENLFRPGRIGKMELKNRIIKPAMGTNYASQDGYVTQPLKDFYSQTARGGAGLVVVEIACVDSPIGKGINHELCIDDDKYIPGLKELAECIKQHGAKAAIQLHHAGREGKSKQTTLQPVGPSAIGTPWGEKPRELSLMEIIRVVTNFAKAAKRAKESGFDGVEIHAAHGYLIAQFLSPASNKRHDAYGGPLENRARILLKIIGATKELVGPSYPLWCRINGCEYGIEDGFTLSEAQEVARMCEDNGAKAIHVSAYGYGAQTLVNLPISSGSLIPLAREIKKVVGIPVIAVGRITPEQGETALRDKSADFISLGRSLLADSDLPQKLQSRQFEDIRPCIACLQCLHSILIKDGPLKCSVNATLGQEVEYKIGRAEQSRQVFIVGGGPAGMEAARVAAMRGHRVVLYDKRTELGGQLIIACKPPRKDRIAPFIDYLKIQVRKLGVKVVLQKEVTAEIVQSAEPEAVVLATGVIPILIEGMDSSNIKIVDAEGVLVGNVEVGDKVIILGGGVVGCETAEFLVDKGKQVTIIEMTKRLALKEVIYIRAELIEALRIKGAKMLMGARYEEISDKGVIVANKEEKKLTIEADTVVVAVGSKANHELWQALEGKVPNLYQIGDCVEPRGILEAIADGFRVGLEI